MTNPAGAMRMLITYVVCIPLAILVGYLLTDPLDYGTLGFLGLVVVLILSPIFIKWHYPILLFSMFCPVTCFFLVGKPPLWEVVTVMSLGIAVLERILNTDRQFLRVPALTWPFLFLAAMAVMTMELTGGFHLHSLGGDTGGSKKYITLFTGIAAYFALATRPIPPARRNLYLALFFLPGALAFIGDLAAYLPSPLNYINLLIPPTFANGTAPLGSTNIYILRLGAFCATAMTLVNFMLARWGTRGIFLGGRLWRLALFLFMFLLIPVGGFRAFFVAEIVVLGLMFYLEDLKGLLLLYMAGGLLAFGLLVPFAGHLPLNYQRTLSFLPMQWDTEVKMDADGSSQWRFDMWHALWPQVPGYLLLGKGFAISKDDYDLIANSRMASADAFFDPAENPLALASDFHSGPLTTLIPFGIWGAIGIVWLMAACLWVHYRNYRYGPPELKVINTFLFVGAIYHCIAFFFIFGAFADDLGGFAKFAGLSVAFNAGVRGPQSKETFNPLIKAAKPLPAGVTQTA